ncbi:MAG: cell division protein ZapA [Lachnospiraceae bacterium]|nr:cell division protein ZapA [Lachnospiraceae bacterium]
MEKSKLKISICGYDFSVVTDEDRQYMLSIANRVERKVNKMLENNGRLSTASAALFAAMDYCDQVQKASGDEDNLRSQIKDYLEESGNARKQLEESKKEIDRLKREITALRRRLAAEEVSKAPASDAEPATEKAPAVPTKKKNKEKKENAPIPGFFSEDAFAESADATAEILSFFEQKSFEDEDE